MHEISCEFVAALIEPANPDQKRASTLPSAKWHRTIQSHRFGHPLAEKNFYIFQPILKYKHFGA